MDPVVEEVLVVSVNVKTLSPEEQLKAFENAKLESISLSMGEDYLFVDRQELPASHCPYELHHVHKESRPLSPRLWHLPEIFKRLPRSAPPPRTVPGVLGDHAQDRNEQRWSQSVHYNFSNGIQLSSQEILRHPAHRNIPGNLLPGHKIEGESWTRWPLASADQLRLMSQSTSEVFNATQALLHQVVSAAANGDIPLFVEAGVLPEHWIPISQITWDASKVHQWNLKFSKRTEIECHAQLAALNAEEAPLFFASYSVLPKSGILCIHSWREEIDEIRKSTGRQMVRSEQLSQGEEAVRKMVRFLRGRKIPVHVLGGHVRIEEAEAHHEIQFTEKGFFQLCLKIHPQGGPDFERMGWATRVQIFLQTITSGLPFLLNQRAVELASRARGKRDWDLKLLKHMGILQYIAFETLSLAFEGSSTDGKISDRQLLFNHLHERIRSILVSGPGVVFVRDLSLSDLCSRPVLTYFEQFVESTLTAIETPETFFNESGEVVIEGVHRREFRMIYELLKQNAMASGGELFRRSRVGFLTNISDGNLDAPLRFPSLRGVGPADLHESLEAVQDLLTVGFKVEVGGRTIDELADGDFEIDFQVQSVKDKDLNWFELNPKFFLKGQEIDSSAVMEGGRGGIIEYEGKMYLVPKKHLPSMKRLEHFWSQILPENRGPAKRKAWDKLYRLPRHQTLELLALRASGVAIRGDFEWERICKFYDALGTETIQRSFPKDLQGELKPYQRSGYQWLSQIYELRLGALLADDMGLGKTVQTLTFLSDLFERKELGCSLIVVPSSLTYNWLSESSKFTPSLPVMAFNSKEIEKVSKSLAQKKDGILLVTYGLLVEHSEFFQQYQWNVVCFDEAQNLKNITAKRTSAARALKARFKLCLTGTPMENHYGEFYSILDLVVPGCLGPMDRFRKEFVNANFVPKEKISHLRLKVKPILLRRTKKEILDQLPEKQETVVSIAFEETQKEIYRDVALSYNMQLRDAVKEKGGSEASVQLQMLTALLRLRQVCSDPSGIPQVVYDKVPPKIETLLDSAEEIVSSGESALVFTQFLKTLEHTQKQLTSRGIPVFVLHGGLSSPQRQKTLEEFNLFPGGAVLLMTLKTGGVGLNLTKASYVFHLEPWWNPSVENQATDRVHRLGQTKAVQVFRYIMHESLEEKIELLKAQKGQRFISLLSDSESEQDLNLGSNRLSQEDFEFLLNTQVTGTP